MSAQHTTETDETTDHAPPPRTPFPRGWLIAASAGVITSVALGTAWVTAAIAHNTAVATELRSWLIGAVITTVISVAVGDIRRGQITLQAEQRYLIEQQRIANAERSERDYMHGDVDGSIRTFNATCEAFAPLLPPNVDMTKIVPNANVRQLHNGHRRS